MKTIKFCIEQANLITKNILIKNITFQLQPGVCLFLNAPNASGKTTLFKTLFKYENTKKKFNFIKCFIEKEQQIYHYNDIKTEDFSELEMFLSFQQPIVIEELKTKDFLFLVFKYSKHNEHKTESELLIEFNNIVNNFFVFFKLNIKLLDNGLNVGISGGEHKKLELLQGILSGSKLWFLDEIETGLDDMSRQKIIDFICNKLTEYGFFIITHNMNFVKQISNKINKNKHMSKIFTIKDNKFIQI